MTEQRRPDELDDLLKPTLQGSRARPVGARAPWRLGSIVYVEFANQGGRYDDLVAFLAQSEVKAAVKRR